jgi:hypothetical protein
MEGKSMSEIKEKPAKPAKPRARRRNYAERCFKVTNYCKASIEMFDSIEKILQSEVSTEARARLEHKKEAYQDILRILAGGNAWARQKPLGLSHS